MGSFYSSILESGDAANQALEHTRHRIDQSGYNQDSQNRQHNALEIKNKKKKKNKEEENALIFENYVALEYDDTFEFTWVCFFLVVFF